MTSLPFSENTAMSSRAASSASSASSASATTAPIIISFDGNIGSGKSTKVRDIENYYKEKGRTDVIFIQEPVDSWNSVVDENGVTILSNYYRDQKKICIPPSDARLYFAAVSSSRCCQKRLQIYYYRKMCWNRQKCVFENVIRQG